MTYWLCACGAQNWVMDGAERQPCRYCGGMLTREEADEAAREYEREVVEAHVS